MSELKPLTGSAKIIMNDWTDEQVEAAGYTRYAPMEPETLEYWEKVWSNDNLIDYNHDQRKRKILESLNRQTQSRGGINFEYSDENKSVLKTLYDTFSGQSHLSQKKGIFLYGGTGTGKTTILRAILSTPFEAMSRDEWEMRKPKITTCIDVVTHFDQSQEYTNYTQNEIYFDDLGSEPEHNYSRKDSERLMGKIIEIRYARNLKTHFTSNLSPNEIGEMYGQRVYSRLFDMCHIIELKGIDLRIK